MYNKYFWIYLNIALCHCANFRSSTVQFLLIMAPRGATPTPSRPAGEPHPELQRSRWMRLASCPVCPGPRPRGERHISSIQTIELEHCQEESQQDCTRLCVCVRMKISLFHCILVQLLCVCMLICVTCLCVCVCVCSAEPVGRKP